MSYTIPKDTVKQILDKLIANKPTHWSNDDIIIRLNLKAFNELYKNPNKKNRTYNGIRLSVEYNLPYECIYLQRI